MKERFLERILLSTSAVARRHYLLVLMAALVGLFVSLFSAWSFLEFETDRDDLISSRDALYENQRKFLLEFPRSDDVVIMVEGGTAQKLRDA